MTYKKFIEILKKSKYLSDYDFRVYGERYKIEHNGKSIVISNDKDGNLILNLTNIVMKNCPFKYTTNASTGVSKVVIPLKEIKTQDGALEAIKWMIDTLQDDELVQKGGFFKKILNFFKGLF